MPRLTTRSKGPVQKWPSVRKPKKYYLLTYQSPGMFTPGGTIRIDEDPIQWWKRNPRERIIFFAEITYEQFIESIP